MTNPADWAALWGLLGAIIYAGPKLTTCVYAGELPGHVTRCLAEATMALLVGTLAAAAFQPFLGNYIHVTTQQGARAMAALIGMLANSTAPGIIRFLGDTLLTRIKGGH